MKKLNLLILLLAASPLAFAQTKLTQNQVPKAVHQSYLSQNAEGKKNPSWSKDKNGVYKVTFKDECKLWESQYKANGSWVKTYTTIGYNEVLPNIKSQVTKLYPDAKVKSSRIELNNEGKFYIVELTDKKQVKSIWFTPSGKLYK